jgi:hypothetical protein
MQHNAGMRMKGNYYGFATHLTSFFNHSFQNGLMAKMHAIKGSCCNDGILYRLKILDAMVYLHDLD